MILFNNSRTGLVEVDCGTPYLRDVDVVLFTSLAQCAKSSRARGPQCSQCPQCSLWVTIGTGANYPLFSFIGDILPEIIRRHLQFQDQVDDEAREALEAAARQRKVDIETSLHMMVGVHVRRTDFHQYSKNWMEELLNETFYLEAMSYLRTKYEAVTFLVVSDDQEWCRDHLQAEDVIVMTGHSPAVDLAIMAQCQAAIVDYGTFSVWGGILSQGEVLVSKHTFRDARWAADYLGWTYI